MKTQKIILASLLALTALSSASYAQTSVKPPKSIVTQLKQYQDNDKTIAKNLKTFDTLDFDVYSNQKWDRLNESHAKDILVHYPDGSTTKGIGAHIAMLKPMFVFAPDTHIDQHPVKFGDKNWTGVVGYLEGTFTQPMPIGNGKFIQPTGKKFKIGMSTLGHWTNKGVMDEEYLFWDNQEFMRQIGLGQ